MQSNIPLKDIQILISAFAEHSKIQILGQIQIFDYLVIILKRILTHSLNWKETNWNVD